MVKAVLSIETNAGSVVRTLERISKQFADYDPVDLAVAIRDTAKMNIVQSNVGYPHDRPAGNMLRSVRVAGHGKNFAEVQAGGPLTTIGGVDYAVIQEQGRGPIVAKKKRMVFRGLFGGRVSAVRVRGAAAKRFFANAIAKEGAGYPSGLGQKRFKAIIDSNGVDNGLRVGITKLVL